MANVTRTIVRARAFVWALNGKGEDGSPRFEKQGFVEYLSTAPNKSNALRALRDAGIKCSKSFVDFEIVGTEVRAMTLETFIANSVPVERSRNGEVVGGLDS